MRDAVSLIGKTLQLQEVKYTINSVNFIPGANKLYIGLIKSDGVTINHLYEDLLPFGINKIKILK
jgi:hypothetical protein